MTPAQAEALRPKLPSGWIAKVSERLVAAGVSYTAGTISRVKSGHLQNAVIEQALLEVAAEEAQRRSELDERIASINP